MAKRSLRMWQLAVWVSNNMLKGQQYSIDEICKAVGNIGSPYTSAFQGAEIFVNVGVTRTNGTIVAVAEKYLEPASGWEVTRDASVASQRDAYARKMAILFERKASTYERNRRQKYRQYRRQTRKYLARTPYKLDTLYPPLRHLPKGVQVIHRDLCRRRRIAPNEAFCHADVAQSTRRGPLKGYSESKINQVYLVLRLAGFLDIEVRERRSYYYTFTQNWDDQKSREALLTQRAVPAPRRGRRVIPLQERERSETPAQIRDRLTREQSIKEETTQLRKQIKVERGISFLEDVHTAIKRLKVVHNVKTPVAFGLVDRLMML